MYNITTHTTPPTPMIFSPVVHNCHEESYWQAVISSNTFLYLHSHPFLLFILSLLFFTFSFSLLSLFVLPLSLPLSLSPSFSLPLSHSLSLSLSFSLSLSTHSATIYSPTGLFVQSPVIRDRTSQGGRIGLYDFSQRRVTFSNFEIRCAVRYVTMLQAVQCGFFQGWCLHTVSGRELQYCLKKHITVCSVCLHLDQHVFSLYLI